MAKEYIIRRTTVEHQEGLYDRNPEVYKIKIWLNADSQDILKVYKQIDECCEQLEDERWLDTKEMARKLNNLHTDVRKVQVTHRSEDGYFIDEDA